MFPSSLSVHSPRCTRPRLGQPQASLWCPLTAADSTWPPLLTNPLGQAFVSLPGYSLLMPFQVGTDFEALLYPHNPASAAPLQPCIRLLLVCHISWHNSVFRRASGLTPWPFSESSSRRLGSLCDAAVYAFLNLPER